MPLNACLPTSAAISAPLGGGPFGLYQSALPAAGSGGVYQSSCSAIIAPVFHHPYKDAQPCRAIDCGSDYIPSQEERRAVAIDTFLLARFVMIDCHRGRCRNTAVASIATKWFYPRRCQPRHRIIS